MCKRRLAKYPSGYSTKPESHRCNCLFAESIKRLLSQRQPDRASDAGTTLCWGIDPPREYCEAEILEVSEGP